MQILDLTKVRLNNVAAAAPATGFYFTVQRASAKRAGRAATAIIMIDSARDGIISLLCGSHCSRGYD